MARLAAGVRKRSDGLYEKRFTVEGLRYSVYGNSSKECEKKEREIRQKLESGLYIKNANLTLNQYYEEWKKSREGIVKEQTALMIESVYSKYYREGIGKRKIRDIEKREIVQLQQELAETLKPTTANHYITCLKTIFSGAVDDDVIVKSPAAGIRRLRTDECEKAADTIHRALTREEQEAFLQESENEWLYNFFVFSLCTGMRILEICALEWKDIDYLNNMIHVTKTLSRRKGHYVETTPKSKTSIRDIPMNEPIRETLKKQKENNLILFGGNAVKMSSKIFVSQRGKQIDSMVARQTIHRIIRNMEKKGISIEPFSHHAFRDTFATRYLEEGGNMQTLKTILGHASLSMTADLYAHVLPTTKQQEMEQIQGAFIRAAGN